MIQHAWVQEFPGAVTVCDAQGIIIGMNATAVKNFEKDGGETLVGQNVLDCHPEPARTKLKEIMDGQKTNVYTIQKGGVKKLIYHAPWYNEGRYSGVVELSLEVPFDLPHFIREG
jgi:transcriptional regulator with PAS, ATPase and Fis domain